MFIAKHIGIAVSNVFGRTGKLLGEKRQNSISGFWKGIKQGLPIALGYIPVSFTFGLMAVNGGIPAGIAILISLTNLTSAGQFAGTGLIIANASLFEIALTTFVINIRYMLMSLSLSQKININTSMFKRCVMALGITDEIFSVASLEKKEVSFSYMTGLTACPYLGWTLGTALGALTTSVLPDKLQSAMGIALYSMFIALIVPASRKSKAAFTVVAVSIIISSAFKWAPYINRLSGGWGIIVTTLTAASLGAIFFPRQEDEI